jgi:hypothetical protein
MSKGADGQRSPPEIRTDRLEAVIFDTSSLHAAAWNQMGEVRVSAAKEDDW